MRASSEASTAQSGENPPRLGGKPLEALETVFISSSETAESLF